MTGGTMMKYVALDIETANRERSSICSIGMVKFEEGEIIDEFYSLIDPEVDDFSYMNIDIHGITEADVFGQPTFPELKRELEAFIGEDIMVAHFSQFDMYGIQDAYNKYRLEIPPLNYICSYRLSKSLYKFPSHKLVHMADYFNVKTDNHHNALADARMAGHITYNILKENNLSIEDFNAHYNYQLGTLGKNGYTKKRRSRS